MKDNSNSIIVFIFVILIVCLFIFFPAPRNVPEGLPNSYYEVIDDVNNSRASIMIYSNEIDLNGDVEYIHLNSLDNLNVPEDIDSYVVIDMNKYINDYTSAKEINDLYNNNCFKIVIVNYHSSNTEYAIDFLDDDDIGSDLIFIQNNAFCYTDYSKNIYDGEFPNIIFLNFAIINNISKDYILD